MSNSLTEQFDQLYSENHNKVYKLAIGLTGNANNAEEITQEAFYRAFRSFDTFRQDSSFFTWIYRITTNIANDYMKYRKKMPVQAIKEDLGYALEEIIDINPANDPARRFKRENGEMDLRVRCLSGCMPHE